MTTIRAIAAEDRADWEPLWAGYLTFYEADIPAETTDTTFARFLDPAEPLHGAIARDAEGRAVGLVHWLTHAATWSSAGYCYLEDLYVDPSTRGSGVGRALIAHVTDWAREAGSAKVYWLTAEDNATARALYERVAERSGFIHYQIDLA